MKDSMKRAIVFCVITFVVTYALIFGMQAAGVSYDSPWIQLIFMVVMFFPGLSSLLTRRLTREGFEDLYLKPRFRGHMRHYLTAWLLPSILIAFGAVVFFLCYPGSLDLDMTAYKSTLPADQAAQFTQSVYGLNLLVAALIAGFINFVPALGEELGWRGYLLPHLMDTLSPRKAVLVSGVIWGLWHAPMIAMGHNYGTGYPFSPWAGILAMVAFCVVLGAFLSWLTVRTGSALPAALAHATVNGVAAGALLLSRSSNPFVGPAPTGYLGGSGLIVCGLICLWRIGYAKPKAGTGAPAAEGGDPV